MRISSRCLLPVAPLTACTMLLAGSAFDAHARDTDAPSRTVGPSGNTIAVTNCNDSGLGSLRAAVNRALSGDTIDMNALVCRRIVLTSGAITIPQDNLTLSGGGDGMTIDGNVAGSVFRHQGTGWLRVHGMTVQRGFLSSDAQPLGGCIYSSGSIDLRYAAVRWCRVRATGETTARGGGLYAAGAVKLAHSQVLGNKASLAAGTPMYDESSGGGIHAVGSLTAKRSRICGNQARFGGGAYSGSGGVIVDATTFADNRGGALNANDGDDNPNLIANSTISGNTGGGPTVGFIRSFYAGGSLVIANSTISGNSSVYHATLSVGSATTSIVNSTIAFNRQSTSCRPSSAAVSFTHFFAPSVHLDSTIVANNTCGGAPYNDLGGPGDTTLEGANNLVTSSNLTLPPDTLSLDPQLAPLADNGGPTQTHAPLDGSPAIDAGNNAAGLAYDQRGPGYPRVKGAQADIGAYER